MSMLGVWPPGVGRDELERHLASGELLDLTGRTPPGRVVDPTVLRAVLIDETLPRDPRGLTVRGMVIHGSLDLRRCVLPTLLALPRLVGNRVDLTGATLTGGLDLTGAHLAWADGEGYALNAEGAKITGSVILDALVVTGGAVSLDGAHISGYLSLDGAQLNGTDEEGTALYAQDVHTSQGLSANGKVPFRAAGAVNLTDASLTGGLDLTGAHLTSTSENGYALRLDRAIITGSVFLDNLIVAKGAVCLSGAHVTGQLSMAGAQLKGTTQAGISTKEETALVAQDVHADQGVFLNAGSQGAFAAAGAVDLADAVVTGGLYLTGARLTTPTTHGYALRLSRSTITGDARLAGLDVTQGAVGLSGAHITGQLNLAGAQLRGTDQNVFALVAQLLLVDRGVFLRADPDRQGSSFAANGGVDLSGATLAGGLDLTGARINGADEKSKAVCADDVTVNGTTDLSGIRVGAGVVSLRAAQLDTLKVDAVIQREGWVRHDFLGLHYNHLEGGPASSARQGLLLLNGASGSGRAAQPYWELADFYDRAGQPVKARWVRFRSDLMLALRWKSWPRLVGYGATTGFGLYPFVAVVWLAVLVLVNATALVGAHRADFVPTAQGVSTTVTAEHCLDSYPCLNPWLFAIDNVVPLVSSGQAKAWRLDTAKAPTWVEGSLYGSEVLGWLFSTLLVGGVAGLVRRR